MSGSQIPALTSLEEGRFGDWRGLYRRPERLANRCTEMLRARCCAVLAESQPRRCGTRLSSPSHSVGARGAFRDGVSAAAAGAISRVSAAVCC